ncbi:MAG: diguanylate cyclase domain-containing protein [Nitrospirota bacterium]
MRRIAIIGGGPQGLETLAHAVRQNRTQVALVFDPDPTALIFRLADFGYEFSDGRRVPVAHAVEELREALPLDVAVDAASTRSIRWAVGRVAPELDVIGANAARYLWSLAELAPAERAPYSLKRFKAVADEIDLSTPGELAYVVAETARLVTGADTARVHCWDDATQRLAPMSPRSGAPTASPLAARAARERRVVHADSGDAASLWLLEDAGAEAALAAPIAGDDDILGAMELWRGHGRGAFSPEATAWLGEFALHAVRAMKKLRTLREVRQLAHAEATRRDLKALLAADAPMHERLQRAVQTLGAILQTSAAHLYVRAPQTGDILLQASTTMRTDQGGAVRIPWGAGLVGEVARFNRPAVLREELAGEPSGVGARTMVAVPLAAGKNAVGVLVVETPSTIEVTHRFVNLLAEAGEIFGSSIASDAERHKMSQKVIKLSAVNEEGLQILALTDRDKLLITGAASTAMILDAEAVVVRVRQRRGDRLLVGGTYGLHRDEIDAALIRVDQAVAAQAAQTKSFLRSDRLDTFGVQLPAAFPYRSVLAGPLFSGDELVGTVSAYNKVLYQSFACGAFDRDDQEILEKFSFYLARALVQIHEFRERQALITIDQVTGLRNQRYLDMRLPEEIRRAERYQRKVSLLIMEVTDFQALSRPFTPQGRDELLRALAGIVRETFRNVDILARLDDARFAVVMPDTGDTMKDVLDRLQQALAAFRLRNADGEPIEVRLAVGTCTYPGEAASVQELMDRANQLHALD